MKRFLTLMIILLAALSTQSHLQTIKQKTNLVGGINAGYNNGIGFQGFLLLKNFAEDFPFNVKISAGMGFLNPGKSDEAREIFINDATNGVPEKSGRVIDFRVDFLYNFAGRTYFYIGPRFAMFTGNFNYVGGNEDFDITSKEWGAGVGIENYFRISPMLDLIFSFGYDYFFPSTLYGHDTSYSPDNENVNSRKNFTFSDADRAINQPKHNLKAMIGVGYDF